MIELSFKLEKDQLTFTYLRGDWDNDWYECNQCHETVDNWSIELHDCKFNQTNNLAS